MDLKSCIRSYAILLFRSLKIGSVFVEIAPQRCSALSRQETDEDTAHVIYDAGYSVRTTETSTGWGEIVEE